MPSTRQSCSGLFTLGIGSKDAGRSGDSPEGYWITLKDPDPAFAQFPWFPLALIPLDLSAWLTGFAGADQPRRIGRGMRVRDRVEHSPAWVSRPSIKGFPGRSEISSPCVRAHNGEPYGLTWIHRTGGAAGTGHPPRRLRERVDRGSRAPLVRPASPTSAPGGLSRNGIRRCCCSQSPRDHPSRSRGLFSRVTARRGRPRPPRRRRARPP